MVPPEYAEETRTTSLEVSGGGDQRHSACIRGEILLALCTAYRKTQTRVTEPLAFQELRVKNGGGLFGPRFSNQMVLS
jgi:hypothetical protein